MKVEIDFTKTIQENANDYYLRSKKAKKKLAGLQKGFTELRKKLESETNLKNAPGKKLVLKRKREWFEKFHWGYTGEGFLVVAGRDAKGNETIVKKIMEKDDFYFHADVHGAPHTLLKTIGKIPGEISKKEAAIFSAVVSKAWAQKISAVDVYSTSPEQVSKKAPSGESLGTGAFMVYGKREWFKKTPLEFSIGIDSKNRIFSGPLAAVKTKCSFIVPVSFGNDSKGVASKKIKAFFRQKTGFDANLDDISALLPADGLSVSLSN